LHALIESCRKERNPDYARRVSLSQRIEHLAVLRVQRGVFEPIPVQHLEEVFQDDPPSFSQLHALNDFGALTKEYEQSPYNGFIASLRAYLAKNSLEKEKREFTLKILGRFLFLVDKKPESLQPALQAETFEQAAEILKKEVETTLSALKNRKCAAGAQRKRFLP